MINIKGFNDFINESVDLKTMDMQADFDRLNTLMFDDEIKRVPLRWMSTKNVVGLMSFDEDGKIRDIGISTFYKFTKQQYLDVLAHEMIHAWMEQKGIREKDPHGSKFLAKVAELNQKFPDFSIKKSENAADYSTSGIFKTKEYGVVLFDEDGVYSIVVVNPNVMDDEKSLDEFIDGIKKYALYKFKKLAISMYKSSHPDLPKFRIKKSLSLKSLELYALSPEFAKDIQKDKLIRTIVLK
jgi:hypothetical protein